LGVGEDQRCVYSTLPRRTKAAWTKDVVERRSWRYEAWSEPPEAELGNLRFLAGLPAGLAARPQLLDEPVIALRSIRTDRGT